MVAGWARRVPFLWAVLPPAALCLAEKLAFNTTYLTKLVGDRFVGVFSHAFVVHRDDDGERAVVLAEQAHRVRPPSLPRDVPRLVRGVVLPPSPASTGQGHGEVLRSEPLDEEGPVSREVGAGHGDLADVRMDLVVEEPGHQVLGVGGEEPAHRAARAGEAGVQPQPGVLDGTAGHHDD